MAPESYKSNWTSKSKMTAQERDDSNTKTTHPTPLALFSYIPLSPNLISQVPKYMSYSFYGSFDANILSTSAASFVESNSNANSESIKPVIHNFLTLSRDYCRSSAKPQDRSQITHSCWLCIRMGPPTDEWKVPRWHRDGRMFECSCSSTPEGVRRPHSKYAMVIIGTATRVLAPSSYVDDVLQSVKRSNEDRGRSEIAEKIAGCEEVAMERGQIIRFSWGQKDSPVHSEPDSTGEHRVFVSVLYGSEDEIRDMCKLRRVQYVRSEIWEA
ncbi:uncharacterized protein BCR38DRAFT_426105 [Pseudomassariella vexata]|uniref:Uncharacterized protein n=1 Tax=Pseudomassariella vexata TaxID=1141098 RepID=A0A1Y2E6P0_9PEZI|nr:uncharacterized protein BCR38DRAFT_426105 [Pseudomassariella vexata]ORY67107.1 hypothetical protein BCR38DRAFT_426105 [Pseudomassariella vexata]